MCLEWRELEILVSSLTIIIRLLKKERKEENEGEGSRARGREGRRGI